MKHNNFRPYLFTPGPVMVPSEVCETLSEPMSYHRTKEFKEIFLKIKEKLKKIFLTENPVLIQTATGTGVMESAIVNTHNPHDTAVAICAGKFGQRWADIGKSYGLNLICHQVPWGEAFKTKDIEKILQSTPKVTSVLCQICETSTGVLHPVEELAQLMKEYPDTLLIVDGTSAVGSLWIPMDQWGIDVLMSGSQKGLMAPTGLACIAFSQKAWNFYSQAKLPRYYFDLGPEKKSYDINETRFSSPVSLIKALDLGIDSILKQGLRMQDQRTRKISKVFQELGEIYHLEIFPKNPSPTLTTYKIPSSLDGEILRRHLSQKYGVIVAGGQDQLKGKILRIGHMGDIQNHEIQFFIESFGKSLIELGVTSFNLSQIEQASQKTLEILES